METGWTADEVIERKEQCEFVVVEDVVEKFIYEDDEEDNEEDNEETNVLQVDDELEDANIPPGRLNISWMNEHDPVEENESDIYKKGDRICNDEVQIDSRETSIWKKKPLKAVQRQLKQILTRQLIIFNHFLLGRKKEKHLRFLLEI